MKKKLKLVLIFAALAVFVFAVLSVFFDEAILVRKGTIYRMHSTEKVVALTFDDGPSAEWTPHILDRLKGAGVKATFFMLGEHVQKYPDVARRVALEGHEIENHTYDHHVLLYYKKDELIKEIKDAEKAIKDVTGQTTRYFRPPKAWVTDREKKIIEALGYKIVLWTLNSKDWVCFDDKYMIKYIMRNVRPGDIILFHDSGGVFGTEGGYRKETVRAVERLIEKLKQTGYRFVTVEELLNSRN